MEASSICFLINAKSHRVARHGSWLDRASLRTPSIHVLHIEDFTKLGQDIRKLVAQGVRKFFIEGGDGTVLAVLSACVDVEFASPPEFAILPGGSTNLAYKSFGFRSRNAKDFQRRLDAIVAGGQVVSVEQRALSIRCNTYPSSITGFVLSTGTLARAMSYVQRRLHGKGHRGSFAVARAIFQFLTASHTFVDDDGQSVLRGSHLSLKTDSAAYEGPHCLSLASSLPRLSLGLNPFWGRETGEISITYLFFGKTLNAYIAKGFQAIAPRRLLC